MMGYKDKKYGGTIIIPDDRYHLIIHWDYDDNENDLNQRKVILFLTPDMNNKDKHGCTEHDHIKLTRVQAGLLRDWLNDFFEEVDGQV